MRALKEQQELQCPFQPQINEVSKLIAHPLRDNGNLRTEDALIKYGRQARERLEQKRSEKLFLEIRECRFKPNISKTSKRMFGGYESDGDGSWRAGSADGREKYMSLYEDALRRKERQEKVYSNCMGPEFTFKPDTTKSKYYYQRLETRDPAYQQRAMRTMSEECSRQPSLGRHHYRTASEGRLSEKERLQRSLKKSATLSNELSDPESGFPWFRPRVGRGPRNPNNPRYHMQDRREVARLLYELDRERRAKLESKRRAQAAAQAELHERVHTTEKSRAMVEERKIARFSDLFRLLDSDRDGLISAERIDVSGLEPEALGVLQLVFAELEETGLALNEDEFVDACYRLYEALAPPQRKVLLRGGASRSRERPALAPRTPAIDANSAKIAAATRGPKEDVALVLLRKKQEYDQRARERRQEKENLELLGCTFHPNITQSPPSSSIKVYSRPPPRPTAVHHNYSFAPQQQTFAPPPQGLFDLNQLAFNVARDYITS